MSTETTPYSPSVAQKLGADCEKLRLVYWLYNNDDNGCGPVQGMPLTFYGSYTMDEFYCDGVNILPDPVSISYTNFNDNFNEWTGALNPLTAHAWDWINAGKPCFRVMATITCDDTVYGDYLLTAVEVIPARFNGSKVLIQPQAIVGPEIEVLVCREIAKDGTVSKIIYTKSGEIIENLAEHYAAQADHLVVSETGKFPFTNANISKFYTEEELCNCLKSCDHEYEQIDESSPCVVRTFENACIYVNEINSEEEEVTTELLTMVSGSELWDQQGNLKQRTLVQGQFQEDASLNEYIDTDELPDGWFLDPTCTGTNPEPPPAECPEGQRIPVNIGGGSYFIQDNSTYDGLPVAHLQNGNNYEFTYYDASGNVVGVWQQTGDPYFNNFIATIGDALEGCTVKSVCANHTSPKGCNATHVANLASYPAYDSPTYPADIQNNLANPDRDELWATGWILDCSPNCGETPVRVVVTNANDTTHIGASKDFNVYTKPDELGFLVMTCDGPVYLDCEGEVIPKPACCPKPWSTCCNVELDLDEYKVIKSRGLDGNYDGAIAITRGRPDNTVEWALVDNRFPPNDGSVRPIVGATFQEFVAEAEAQGYSEFIIGEIHYLCPCPPGLEQAGDYFVTAGGQTQTKPACTPLTELEGSPDKEAPEEECALRTAPCPSDVDIAALECLKDIKLLLTCCPRLDVGGATYTTGDNTGSLVQFPVTAGNPTLDYTVPLSIGEHECLSPDDVLRVRWCFEHELDASTTHIGFNVLPVAAGTLIETSNGAGGVGNPNIGPAVPHNGPRTKQWADFEFTVAELQAGVAVQTCAFGTTDTLTETIHNQSFEIITDLAAMGCCA